MIETKTKTIDGLLFTSTQLPPLRAYPLAARVAGILLPALNKLPSDLVAESKADDFLSQDFGKLIPALEPLLEALAKKENEDLPQKLLAGTTVQVPDDSGEMTVRSLVTPEAINAAFQGRGLTMIKAMWFAVEVNFRDFFGGALNGAPTKASEAKASG